MSGYADKNEGNKALIWAVSEGHVGVVNAMLNVGT